MISRTPIDTQVATDAEVPVKQILYARLGDVDILDLRQDRGLIVSATGDAKRILWKSSIAGEINWRLELSGARVREAHLADNGSTVILGQFEQWDSLEAQIGGRRITRRKGDSSIFLAEIDSSGNVQWTLAGMAGLLDNGSLGIAVAADQSTYLHGGYVGRLTIGDLGRESVRSVQAYGASEYSQDGFIARISSGHVDWIASLGGIGADAVHHVGILRDGEIIATGSFDGLFALGAPGWLSPEILDTRAYFGDISLRNKGEGTVYNRTLIYDSASDGFIARLDDGEFTSVVQVYDETEAAGIWSASPTADGGFIVSGYDKIGQYFGDSRNANGVVVKLTADNAVAGFHEMFAGASSSFNPGSSLRIIPSQDEGFYATSKVFPSRQEVQIDGAKDQGYGGYDGLVAKFDAARNVEWLTILGSEGNEEVLQSWPSSDGIYLVAESRDRIERDRYGSVTYEGGVSIGADFVDGAFLVKLDGDGNFSPLPSGLPDALSDYPSALVRDSPIDFTGDGLIDPKDTLLMMRHMIGTFPGDAIAHGIPGISDVDGLHDRLVKSFEEVDVLGGRRRMDIDGDGIIHPLSDGLAISHYVHGNARGTGLEAIQAHIKDLVGF